MLTKKSLTSRALCSVSMAHGSQGGDDDARTLSSSNNDGSASRAKSKQYEDALSEKDRTIAELKAKLDSETRKCSMLESELSLTVAAAQHAEAAHGTELARVEADVSRVLAERRPLLEKLQSIEMVEDAVRELYLHMKDRVGERLAPGSAQLEAEKETLKHENILVVLGMLHAQLKNVWAFKVEAEADVRALKTQEKARQEERALALRNAVRDVQAELALEQKQTRGLAAKLQAAHAINAQVQAESAQTVAEMQKLHQELLQQLEELQEENAGVREALRLALSEGRQRDNLLLRNRQLESARHFDRVAADRELRSLQTVHNKELLTMQAFISTTNTLMKEHDETKTMLTDAESKLAATKSTLTHYGGDELQKQLARLTLALKEEKEHVAELTGQVSKLKARVGMRERQLESLARQAGIELPPEMRPQAASWSRGAAAAELPSSQQVLRNAQKLGKKKEKDDPNDPIYKTIRNVNPMRTQARAGLKSVKQAVADALPLSRDMVPKEEEYVIPSEPSQLPMTEIPLGAFAGAPTLSSLAASSGEGGL